MRRLPLILFALFIYALAVMLLHKNEPAESVNSANNKPLPPISIRSFDGKTAWNATALHGHVTVLNFFASWCSPCAEEMPQLAALKKQFPTIKLEGVAWNDKPRTLNAWLKKYNNPFEGLWIDKDGSATIALGIRGIPETFVIDSNGVVRYRLAGPLTEDLRNGEFGQTLTQLLTEAEHAR
jgi:DsbE subfamily thiol:disulfide oxidoreductase